MRKLLLLPALVLLFTSCDQIFKERDTSETEVKSGQKVVLGTDKDDKGCVTSAGYKWSLLRKECIRVFEEGYRLNAIDSLKTEDMAKSAFVVFDKERTAAELYLPNSTKSLLMKKEGGGRYTGGTWILSTKKGYQLQKQNRVIYAGAAIEENKTISDDWKGGSLNPEPAVSDSVTN